MADQKTTITSPIEIKPDSEARVALDLAKIIAENDSNRGEESEREYWLTLYYQCRMATTSKHNLKNILEAHSPTAAELLKAR